MSSIENHNNNNTRYPNRKRKTVESQTNNNNNNNPIVNQSTNSTHSIISKRKTNKLNKSINEDTELKSDKNNTNNTPNNNNNNNNNTTIDTEINSLSTTDPYMIEHGNQLKSSYRYWLMKNEPPYSLYNLSQFPIGQQYEPWVGVRNSEAKNIMKEHMKIGDYILYYEASITNPYISGIGQVDSLPYPDETAWNKSNKYYCSKYNNPNEPYWYLVNIKFIRLFQRPIYLLELKYHIELQSLVIFRKFRLSISPLSIREYQFICELENKSIPNQVLLKLKPEKKKNKIIPVNKSIESNTNENENTNTNNEMNKIENNNKKGKPKK